MAKCKTGFLNNPPNLSSIKITLILVQRLMSILKTSRVSRSGMPSSQPYAQQEMCNPGEQKRLCCACSHPGVGKMRCFEENEGCGKQNLGLGRVNLITEEITVLNKLFSCFTLLFKIEH